MSVKLEYAHKQVEDELKLVHVGDVVRGLKCNCTCPSCGKKLIAKNKPFSKVKHHFQHYQAEECAYAVETSLHLLAKEIIAESKQIMLPGEKIVVKEEYPSYGSLAQRTKIFLTPELKKVDSVTVEKKFDSIVPDLLLNINGSRLLVEIYVTHKVDQTKKKYLETNKLNAIEIDLHKEKRDLTKQLLEEYIFNAKKSTWIFYDVLERLKLNFQQRLKEDIVREKEFREKEYHRKNLDTTRRDHRRNKLNEFKVGVNLKSNAQISKLEVKYGRSIIKKVIESRVQECPKIENSFIPNPELYSCLQCEYNLEKDSKSNNIFDTKNANKGYIKCICELFIDRYIAKFGTNQQEDLA